MKIAVQELTGRQDAKRVNAADCTRKMLSHKDRRHDSYHFQIAVHLGSCEYITHLNTPLGMQCTASKTLNAGECSLHAGSVWLSNCQASI